MREGIAEVAWREMAAAQKHPRGLYTLFFTEMWERFSYYGMRALLVLFMVDAVRADDGNLVPGNVARQSDRGSDRGQVQRRRGGANAGGLLAHCADDGRRWDGAAGFHQADQEADGRSGVKRRRR